MPRSAGCLAPTVPYAMLQFTSDACPCASHRDRFLRECWGVRPHAAALDDRARARLVEDFARCKVGVTLAACRKVDNSRYSQEEREEMERDLEGSSRTLNLPYCFTRGACDLYATCVDGLGDLANDVEVGVYLSKVGGDVAEWHCDNNHNFTIQLAGSKEWHCLPGGSSQAEASRSLFEPARNRAEGAVRAPPLGEASVHVLGPGSVLYLPPGHWHRVIPAGGPTSFSVDIRIGHLSAARWLSEALFATLSDRHSAQLLLDGTRQLNVRERIGALETAPCVPQGGHGPSRPAPEAMRALASSVGAKLADVLSVCPVPRAIPCEAQHSDGMNRGGTLDFLVSRRFLCDESALALSPSTELAISPIAAITLKRRDADGLTVQLLAASALTGMEYCRYGVLCEAELHEPLAALVGAGTMRLARLLTMCAVPDRLVLLLRALVHANLVSPRLATAVSGGSHTSGSSSSAHGEQGGAAGAAAGGGRVGERAAKKKRRREQVESDGG
jgi:hypothetical protein